MSRAECLEKEMSDFNDAAMDACDLHLMDLAEHHKPKTGELNIKPTFHDKRLTDKRILLSRNSTMALIAEGHNAR